MVAFLADECFAGPLIRALRTAGYDVVRSAETMPSAPDEQVLALFVSTQRVLLTEDNDFGDLIVRLGHPTVGVVRVELRALERVARGQRLVTAIAALGDRVEHALITIEPRRTRLRTLLRPTQ